MLYSIIFLVGIYIAFRVGKRSSSKADSINKKSCNDEIDRYNKILKSIDSYSGKPMKKEV